MQSSLGEELFAVGQFTDHQLFDARETVGDGSSELRVTQVDSGNDRYCGRVVCTHDVDPCPVVGVERRWMTETAARVLP